MCLCLRTEKQSKPVLRVRKTKYLFLKLGCVQQAESACQSPLPPFTPPTCGALVLAPSPPPRPSWLLSSSGDSTRSSLIRARSLAAPRVNLPAPGRRYLRPRLHIAAVDVGRQPGVAPLASWGSKPCILYASHAVGGRGGGVGGVEVRGGLYGIEVRKIVGKGGIFCTETGSFSHIPEVGILSSLS